MLVLGINGFLSPIADDFMPERWPLHYHDAAAVLVHDCEVVAGVEQERLNRIKHTTRFAGEAIQSCLDTAGATLRDVDRVAFFVDEKYTDRELYQHYAQHPRLPVLSSRELLADRLRKYFDVDLSSDLRIRPAPHCPRLHHLPPVRLLRRARGGHGRGPIAASWPILARRPTGIG